MSDFDDYPFSSPKIGVSTWIYWNFSSQVKIRYLRWPFVKFLQQLNDYSENDLVLKLIMIFLLVVMLQWPEKVVILYGP